MTAITAKPITATPITARPLTAYRLGESTDVSRWYLHWGGVNEYAQHSTWNMSGFGDVVSETITPAAPGTGDQYLWANADASWGLYIDDSTGDLILDYVDVDGSTARTITGPALSAGETVSYSIEFAADGVTMTVGATDYTNANTPELGSIVYLSANNTPASYFQGARENLRYTNATPLQGVNAVQSDGVNLTGTIPAITLTSATISFPLLYKSGNQTILTGSAAILTVSSDLFVKGANVTSLLVDGQEYASETLVDGQHYDIVIAVDGGTLTTIGQMVSGGVMGTLTVDDAVFDLSGDDGSTIPNTGVGSDGTWNNYDPGTDQVALPILSRRYEIKDGPDALFLEDANHPAANNIVVNGDFASGLTGWTYNNSDPADCVTELSSAVPGGVRVTRGAGGIANAPGYAASGGLVIGKTYLQRITVLGGTNSGGRLFWGGIGGKAVFVAAGAGEHSRFITAASTNINADIWVDQNHWCEFDSVEVIDIETGAVLYNTAPEDWSRSKS